DKINDWMRENVWKRADLLDADAWLKEITGRDFDPTDFLDYLEEKFSKLYELD
ncbi:MAG: carboxypeptidase M32, partial [Butyrivibrio sp.]|nr:carboxypeptidase M32 [Butyrivibrio sp.]